ncbi:S8 family serine peptidase [Actinoplanes sp. NPDC048791]|uniref:S8 family serine peptidase n=1 Tax=Actinoplanes sp. NPDC048791 TaxID=3154623 RepID=UPI0033FD0857
MSLRYGSVVLAALGAVIFSTPLAAVAGPQDGAAVDTIATVLDEGGRPTFIEVEAATVAQERRKAAAMAGVVEVSTEVPAAVLATPDDTYRAKQWGNAKLASDDFAYVATGSQLVAVLDTGIRSDHEDFAPGQIRCDIGADFTDDGQSTNGCADPHGHGTHVAGTVGAVFNNGKGVAGIAPGVPILPVRVLGPTGQGSSTSVSDGIVYAVDHRATVITMSIGGGYAPSYDSAIKYATEHNVVVVAAVGNNRASGNTRMWPGASPGAEGVAATDSQNVTAAFSNSSGTADIAAPGVNIISTDRGGHYSYKSGTSMATPHVAAAAALYRATHPGSTEAGTRAALESTATDIESAGRDAASGAGLLNLTALLPAPPGAPPAAPRPVTPAPSVPVKLVVVPSRTAISLSWAASEKTATTPGATSYAIYRNGLALDNTTTVSFVDKTIAAATNYTYTVAAIAGDAFSRPSAGVPAYLTPAAPTKLVVTATATSIALRWTAPEKLAISDQASGYRVYRDGVPVATTAVPTYTDQAGTNHAYSVSAINPAGESARTDSTVAYLVPAAPTALAALTVAGTSKLTWRAPVAQAAVSGTPVSYKVYREGALLASVTTLAYTDTTAPAGANPAYTVSAVNPAGESARSNKELAYKAPATPAGLSTTATIGAIRLDWRAPVVNAGTSAATAYAVQRDGVQLATTAGLSYTDTSAAANVTYKYTVTASNAAGASKPSSMVQRLWTYPAGKLLATTATLTAGSKLNVTGTSLKPGTTVTFTEAYKVTTTTTVNNKPVPKTVVTSLVLGSAVADNAGNLAFSALPAQVRTAATVTATAIDMNGKAFTFTLALTLK